MTLRERIRANAHAQHVALHLLVPGCAECDALAAKRPEWLRHLTAKDLTRAVA